MRRNVGGVGACFAVWLFGAGLLTAGHRNEVEVRELQASEGSWAGKDIKRHEAHVSVDSWAPSYGRRATARLGRRLRSELGYVADLVSGFFPVRTHSVVAVSLRGSTDGAGRAMPTVRVWTVTLGSVVNVRQVDLLKEFSIDSEFSQPIVAPLGFLPNSETVLVTLKGGRGAAIRLRTYAWDVSGAVDAKGGGIGNFNVWAHSTHGDILVGDDVRLSGLVLLNLRARTAVTLEVHKDYVDPGSLHSVFRPSGGDIAMLVLHGTRSREVAIWSVATGAVLCRAEYDRNVTVWDRLAYDGDSAVVCRGVSNPAIAYDVRRSRGRCDLVRRPAGFSHCNDAALGRVLLVSGTSASVAELDGGRIVSNVTLSNVVGCIYGISFSPGGRYALIDYIPGDPRGSLVWDFVQGHHVHMMEPSFSHDGSAVASLDDDDELAVSVFDSLDHPQLLIRVSNPSEERFIGATISDGHPV